MPTLDVSSPEPVTIGTATVTFTEAEAIRAAVDFAYNGPTPQRGEDFYARCQQAVVETLRASSDRRLAIGATLVGLSHTVSQKSSEAYAARRRTSSRKLGAVAHSVVDLAVSLLDHPTSALRIRQVRDARRALGRESRELLPEGVFAELRSLESEILSMRRAGAFPAPPTPVGMWEGLETDAGGLSCDSCECGTGPDFEVVADGADVSELFAG
jgi:hypothetical protein